MSTVAVGRAINVAKGAKFCPSLAAIKLLDGGNLGLQMGGA